MGTIRFSSSIQLRTTTMRVGADGCDVVRASLIIMKRFSDQRHVEVRIVVVPLARKYWSLAMGVRAGGCAPAWSLPDADAHDRALRVHVEQLAAVSRPVGLRADTGRHGNALLVDVRIRPHVDLGLVRIIGLVSEPAAIRRQLGTCFAEWPVQQRLYRNVPEWGRTALYVWALSRLIAPSPSGRPAT